MNNSNVKLSIVLPCLNEEASVGICIEKIFQVLIKNNIDGEIIAVDNNSTDRSAEIIKNTKAVYVFEQSRGYGNAYLAGIKRAQGKYIIMGDPDGSYDFSEIPKFLYTLENEIDFVIGSRFAGQIEKGAMPFLHRYVGNPMIRFLLRSFYGLNISEPSTGFIGIGKNDLDKMMLKQTGMEFSSEILVKVKKHNLKIKELPITYHRRQGRSKLRTWRDGFRHLKFLLKYVR